MMLFSIYTIGIGDRVMHICMRGKALNDHKTMRCKKAVDESAVSKAFLHKGPCAIRMLDRSPVTRPVFPVIFTFVANITLSFILSIFVRMAATHTKALYKLKKGIRTVWIKDFVAGHNRDQIFGVA